MLSLPNNNRPPCTDSSKLRYTYRISVLLKIHFLNTDITHILILHAKSRGNPNNSYITLPYHSSSRLLQATYVHQAPSRAVYGQQQEAYGQHGGYAQPSAAAAAGYTLSIPPSQVS